METLSHAESRRLYSWWWDSHISPKNSKWLQENLADMDIKVKSMIKLIEEDADSFRKRAEMYYRKRPELMKLVEEFYRAYRALAERYDHATSALHQAHRTMAEAFPDQVPLMLLDESPTGSSFADTEPHTSKNLSRDHPLFDINDLHNDTNISKKGPKKPTTGEEEIYEEFANGWARNGKDFQDVNGKGQDDKVQQEVCLLSEENQNLKTQLTRESERADKAEAEVENLKATMSKLESEKAVVSLQYQLSREKISSLEADISCIHVDLKKLNDDLLVGTTKSRGVEDRCHQLEGEIQSLQFELGMLEGTAKKQQQELNMKQEELEKLNISIKEEHERSMQAEVARFSLEKLHSQSQDEVKILTLETQNWVEKLMNVEMSKVGLEEEIQRLKEEIASLNEQIRSSALKIKNLQGEISLLEGSKRKLENELGMHVEEKKYLKQEVLSIKADKKEIEQTHNELMGQIGAVNLNVEALQAMVRELRDGNVELKELCQKHEDERMLHLESLKFMEKITRRNFILENSLSNANAELAVVREKVKTLEESCETLRGKISIHISEKVVLVSQIEAIARNMEKLLAKNGLLENSLSDVNVELEVLREKLNALEKSCQSLHDQNSSLLAEKSTLVTQVEDISQSLENLERKYAELESKNLNMETEKDQILHQVRDLQQSLRTQKEEYETLTQSSRSHLEALENQIRMLQEKGRLKEEELEVENHKIVHIQIEIFILQRILHDMKENNVLLSDKCQKFVETSRCQEELISELKQESLRQQKMVTWLSQYNEKLVEGIHQVTKSLNISEECRSPDALHFELLLLKIEDLKTSIVDAQDDNQHMVLEKSVILTLLEQYVLHLAELQSEKEVLERESETRFRELLALQSEKHQMLELNECLRQDVQACNKREEVLKVEMEILRRKLSDLQQAHSVLQSDTSKLIEENQSFSKKIDDLSEENDILEEDNSALVAETMKLEHLYLIFRSYYGERAHELQLVSDNVDCLRGVSSGLEQEIRLLNEKLGAVEAENMNLKESLVNLEECRRCLVILEDEVETTRHTCQELNLEIEIGKRLLMQKDTELLQVNHKIEAVVDENTELNGKIKGLMMDIDEAKAVREELEKKNLTLLEYNNQRDNEVADLHHAKDALNQQLVKLCEEVEELKRREKHLTSELEDGVQEVKSCEAEIASLLSDIHITTINAATFEEMMFELLIKCESLEISSMIQKEMFYEEITRRNVYEDEMKEKVDALGGENGGLKEELGAYLPLILSLGDFVNSLEQRILPLASHRTLSNQEKHDGQQPLQQKKNNAEGDGDYHVLSSFGIFELQRLHAKVCALEETVVDILSLLEHDRCVSKTIVQAPGRESEGLKSKGTADLEQASIGKDIILHLKKKEETGSLKKGNAEICEDKSEQMMKDIQLDHVLSPSRNGNGASSHTRGPIGGHEAKDQVMELWETMDHNKMAKPSPVTSERDLECHQIEAVEEEKSVCPSSRLVVEKELSIDKLELTVNTESHEEWSGSTSERLSSDAQRLSALQKSAKELKRTMEMETSELSEGPARFEYKKVKAQLKEADAAITQLIDANNKLTKKADKLSSSSGSLLGGQIDEMENTTGRKISEQARRGSEKIGRLELELQKLEYIWLKLKEEHDYKKARAAERRTRLLLRDYISGKRESPRRKKVHCCACIRPRTMDE